jgi:hypothetical protein
MKRERELTLEIENVDPSACWIHFTAVDACYAETDSSPVNGLYSFFFPLYSSGST